MYKRKKNMQRTLRAYFTPARYALGDDEGMTLSQCSAVDAASTVLTVFDSAASHSAAHGDALVDAIRANDSEAFRAAAPAAEQLEMYRDSYGWSLIHLAVLYRTPGILRYLLCHCSLRRFCDDDGFTPWHVDKRYMLTHVRGIPRCVERRLPVDSFYFGSIDETKYRVICTLSDVTTEAQEFHALGFLSIFIRDNGANATRMLEPFDPGFKEEWYYRYRSIPAFAQLRRLKHVLRLCQTSMPSLTDNFLAGEVECVMFHN